MKISEYYQNANGIVGCLQPDCSVHVIDISGLDLEEHDPAEIRRMCGEALYAGYETVGRRLMQYIDAAYRAIGVDTKEKPDSAYDAAVQTILGEVALGAIANAESLCSPWGFLDHEIANTVHEILADVLDDDTPAYED